MSDPAQEKRPPTELAADAVKREAWAEAVPHWCATLATRPGDLVATVGLGDALAKLGAEGAAAVIVNDLLEKHPDDTRLIGMVAQRAERGRDVALAIAMRRRLAAAAPDDQGAAMLLGRALRDGGHTAESAEVLAAVDARFPNKPGVLRERAFTAMATEEWALARDCWAAIVKLDSSIAQAANWQKLCSERADAVPAKGPAAPAAPRRQAAPEIAPVLGDVVRLGAGPELGEMLRDYGLAPAGPLAFARASSLSVIEAMRDRFDGFADLASLRLEADGSEYVAVDTRYGIRVPTGVATGEVASPAILVRVGEELRAARDALLIDLESGSKLFVHSAPDLDDSAIDSLMGAMRDIGPITALFVRVAANPDEAGIVDEIQEGMFVAALDRLRPEAGEEPSALWLDVCARAHRRLASRAALGGFAARRRAA